MQRLTLSSQSDASCRHADKVIMQITEWFPAKTVPAKIAAGLSQTGEFVKYVETRVLKYLWLCTGKLSTKWPQIWAYHTCPIFIQLRDLLRCTLVAK